MHLQRRVETCDLCDLGLVVMAHIQTGPDPDLQDAALRPRNDFLALPAHRLNAAGEIDQVGQDVTVVPALAHVSATSRRWLTARFTPSEGIGAVLKSDTSRPTFPG